MSLGESRNSKIKLSHLRNHSIPEIMIFCLFICLLYLKKKLAGINKFTITWENASAKNLSY
jgi:hypothetical protein